MSGEFINPNALSGVGSVFAEMARTARYIRGNMDAKAFPERAAALEKAADAVEMLPELLNIIHPFVETWSRGGPNYDKEMRSYWDYDKLCKLRSILARIGNETA